MRIPSPLTFSAWGYAIIVLASACAISSGDKRNGAVASSGNATSPRGVHTATLLNNGKVLLAGGLLKAEGDEISSSSAELYDPATGRFIPTGKMSAERAGHTATLLKSGDVLVTGGGTASAEIYQVARGQFIPAGLMSTNRERHAATLLKDGKVLITGGSNRNPIESAEFYDPLTNSFTLAGEMSSPRFAHASTLLPDGNVLLTGGASNWRTVLATAEVFDSVNKTFSLVGNMTVSRHKHAAMLMPNGRVLIAGGSSSAPDWEGRHRSAEVYNPAKASFSPTGEMKESRFKIPSAIALTSNGRVLICGGAESIEVYDPGAGVFGTAYGKLSDSLFYPTATTLLDGRVLIVGGYDDDLGVSAATWVYTPPPKGNSVARLQR